MAIDRFDEIQEGILFPSTLVDTDDFMDMDDDLYWEEYDREMMAYDEDDDEGFAPDAHLDSMYEDRCGDWD